MVRDGEAFPKKTRPWGQHSWDLGLVFTSRKFAVEAAEKYLREYPGWHLDVVEGFDRPDIDRQLLMYDTANVVWCSDNPEYQRPHIVARIRFEGSDMQHDGVTLPQPINIDKEQLVASLQANLDEEAAERQKVEDKERQARLGVDQFVTDHQDEIVEFLGRQFGGSWRQVEEHLAEAFKDDAYKPQKLKKTRKETDLEKALRVLAMSTDKTIEVQPTSQWYDLL